LLYEYLRAVSDAGFQIAVARITTEKGAAIDSFYITDLKGRKVTAPHELNELRRTLQHVSQHRPGAPSA
jgi:[protein-PII] uridylyltransferase